MGIPMKRREAIQQGEQASKEDMQTIGDYTFYWLKVPSQSAIKCYDSERKTWNIYHGLNMDMWYEDTACYKDLSREI